MFWLGKMFQYRDKLNPGLSDKPFLEHLNDLRSMLFKMIITLLITTALSFAFSDKVMDVLRQPVDEVWGMYEQQHLPEDFKESQWMNAKKIAHCKNNLPAPVAQTLAAEFDEKTQLLAECVPFLEAARTLPEKSREQWLNDNLTDKNTLELTLKLEKCEASLDMDPRNSLQMMGAFQPTEAFMLSMKIAFYSGVVIGFPFLMYFLLQFILPGLEVRERKMLWPSLGIGFGLFLFGVAFAYFIVLPKVLTFFFEYGLSLGILNEWRIGYYISFITQFVLLFGLAFELPVVVMILVKIGILHYKIMAETRSYAIIGILVLAAVLTPTPDIVTLLLMAGPMYFLYEICVFLAWLEARKKAKLELEEGGQET